MATPLVAAAGETPSERLLTQQVYAYFSIPSVDALKERFQETKFSGLFEEQGIKDFAAQLEDKYNEAASNLQEKLGMSVSELLAIPSGEFAVAVTRLEGFEVGIIAMIDYGDSGDAVDKFFEQYEEAVEEKGVTWSSESFEGTEIVTYEYPQDEDAEADAPVKAPSGFSMFRKDSTLVIGNTPAALESVLVRWDGDHPETFAGNEVYDYVLQQTSIGDRAPAMKWFVDPVGGIEIGIQANADKLPQAQMALGFLPVLGLRNMRGWGGSVDLATEEFESVSQSLLYIDPPVTGVLGLFSFPETDLSVPDWAPNEATGYAGMNWDAEKAYDTVRNLYNMFQGQNALEKLVDTLADSPTGPSIHIKDDIVDQIDGRIHVVNFPVELGEDELGETSLQNVQQDMIVAIDVVDADKMKSLMSKMADGNTFPGKIREFEGQTIYEMPNQAAASGGPESFAVTIANDAIVMSTDVKRVESMLRGVDRADRLAGDGTYQRVASHFPVEVSMVGYQNADSQLKPFWEMFRTDKVPGVDVKEVDFTKLPPFEVIQKYLAPSGSYVITDDKGAKFVSFGVRPE
ncbi:hypothetical protein [Stratiformator vulcanicus]|nr:hypothetical protein [Stratiformator vulcanicus]